jgi:hypothetical protein
LYQGQFFGSGPIPQYYSFSVMEAKAVGNLRVTVVSQPKVSPHSADKRMKTAQIRVRPRQAPPEKAELLETQNQPGTGPVRDASDVRRKPRFKLAVDISIHSESCGSLKGRTLDISEIGLAAVLGDDIPVGEVVKLNITLPSGPVTTRATVRTRSSFFRYGFEFVQPNSVSEILKSACRQLSLQQPG